MPVFIKAGTILPFGPEVQYSSEKPWDELEIRVYPGADGKFTLYEDEGDNYNYEKGKFSEIQFVWNEADRTLNIAPRKGSYKGMLQHRRFHIVLVDANSGAGDQPMQASKSVEYDGKAVKIQL
jgi:alpha-D-xyloside xylohydrolase